MRSLIIILSPVVVLGRTNSTACARLLTHKRAVVSAPNSGSGFCSSLGGIYNRIDNLGLLPRLLLSPSRTSQEHNAHKQLFVLFVKSFPYSLYWGGD